MARAFRSTEVAVRVSHVSKRFKKSYGESGKPVQALSDVSFNIHKGEIFGLLGPNGAGKSTLISILMGLLEKDAGKVEILGFDLDTDELEIKKRANVVSGFIQPLEVLTGRQLLNYYALLYSVPNRASKIQKVIDFVELNEHADRPAQKYSSGQRQRLFIARALLNDPELLFLDEPTVGLDVRAARKVRRMVKALQKQGVTILLTTHYMKEAEELSDRIAVINNGKLVALDSPANLKTKLNAKTKGKKGGGKADLEEVFLALTKKPGADEDDEDADGATDSGEGRGYT